MAFSFSGGGGSGRGSNPAVQDTQLGGGDFAPGGFNKFQQDPTGFQPQADPTFQAPRQPFNVQQVMPQRMPMREQFTGNPFTPPAPMPQGDEMPMQPQMAPAPGPRIEDRAAYFAANPSLGIPGMGRQFSPGQVMPGRAPNPLAQQFSQQPSTNIWQQMKMAKGY